LVYGVFLLKILNFQF